MKDRIVKIYLEGDAENRLRKKQAECNHSRYICKCSLCNAILDSDALHEYEHTEILIDNE